jgi:hypothetical protein
MGTIVTMLLEAGAIESGAELRLNLDQFSPEEREVINRAVQDHPDVGLAEWTGLGIRKALRWRKDGNAYSATGLVKQILDVNGCEVHTLAGPRYWEIPGGQRLSNAGSIIEGAVDEEY